MEKKLEKLYKKSLLESELPIRRFDFLIGGIPRNAQYLIGVSPKRWGRRSFHVRTRPHSLSHSLLALSPSLSVINLKILSYPLSCSNHGISKTKRKNNYHGKKVNFSRKHTQFKALSHIFSRELKKHGN